MTLDFPVLTSEYVFLKVTLHIELYLAVQWTGLKTWIHTMVKKRFSIQGDPLQETMVQTKSYKEEPLALLK